MSRFVSVVEIVPLDTANSEAMAHSLQRPIQVLKQSCLTPGGLLLPDARINKVLCPEQRRQSERAHMQRYPTGQCKYETGAVNAIQTLRWRRDTSARGCADQKRFL